MSSISAGSRGDTGHLEDPSPSLDIVVVVLDAGQLPDPVHAFAASVSPARTVSQVADLKDGLNVPPQTPVVIVTEGPEHRVAAALSRGEDAAIALDHWTAESRDLLSSVQSTDRQVQVVARQALEADPSFCASALAGAFGMTLASVPDGGGHQVEFDPLAIGLAVMMIQANHEARQVAAGLFGTTGLAHPRFDAEALAKSQARLNAVERVEAECALLREGMTQMQGRLEQRVLDMSNVQTALESAKNRQRLIQQRAEKREATMAAGLLTVCRQRDEAAAELIALREKLEASEAALSSANTTIDDVYGSRSWRLTHPMRAVRKGFGKT